MRVLVTGGRGQIGTALVKYLKECPIAKFVCEISSRSGSDVFSGYTENGKTFSSGNIDLTKEEHVKNILKLGVFDIIFHLAGNALNDGTNKTKIIDDNIKATYNLIANCNRGTRFVFASTANVYGNGTLEKKSSETDSTNILSTYTATKYACEKLIEAETNMGNIDGLILRYVANVSPNPTHGAIRAIIEKCISAEENSVIELFGTKPGSIKNYMHVDDTAIVTANLGLNPQTKGIFNVSTDDVISIQQIFYLIRSALRKELEYKFVGYAWHGDCNIVNISNEKMKEFVPVLKFKSSRDAIYKAIDNNLLIRGMEPYYNSHYHNLVNRQITHGKYYE